MLNWILNTFVGDYNTKQLKKIEPLIVQINDRYARFDDLTDQQIKDKTIEFKERL
jgi:preprotein translocase subunit SecA